MRASQRSFFNQPRFNEPNLNELVGFSYRPALLDQAEEATLLTQVRNLPFREFEFHGYTGKRRVVSFGWKYDFSGQKLREADELPEFLWSLRGRAASFAKLKPEAFEQVLVTEYRPGAGIGWHRDKGVFGEVVGVSLLAPCILRFRRKVSTAATRTNEKWTRVNVLAEPRSAYYLTGPSRSEWQHSILRVDALRYSITFRTMA